MKGDDDAALRLATYGTLAPGRPNAHQLAGLDGCWTTGTVRGHLANQGWGSAMGYPGIVLDNDAPEIEVHLFASRDLLVHWPRLDAFEGEGYRRAVAQVRTAEGMVAASIYVLSD